MYYVFYVHISEGIRIKFFGFFLKSRVSEIRVKQIQGVGVYTKPNPFNTTTLTISS